MNGAPYIIITCEHAGRELPIQYLPLFQRYESLLDTHRAWDPGALDLARHLSNGLNAPIYYTETTRLLIETNRSIRHKQLFSEVSATLPKEEKKNVIQKYYSPFRMEVEREIEDKIKSGKSVWHFSIHSFSPVMDGIHRNADIGILFDPKRASEKTLAKNWRSILNEFAPVLKVRFNYPYLGTADGFATHLRKKHLSAYLGIELEVNQKFASSDGKHLDEGIKSLLLESLEKMVCSYI